MPQINRPVLWGKEQVDRRWGEEKKHTELMMREQGSYMSADIQER